MTRTEIISRLLFGFTVIVANVVARAEELPTQTGTQWVPFMAWSLENDSFEGNPFDLIATVTFVHASSGEIRRTEMFYAGDRVWQFRFCGIRPGRWTFSTASADPDLDGHTGLVQVDWNNRDYGFVGASGNKWIRQKGRVGRSKAFVPQYVMYHHPAGFAGKPEQIDSDIQTFMGEHGFNGFHVPIYCRWFDIEHDRSNDIVSEDPNPDIHIFEALEMLITKVHSAGGVVHFWAWGDESRKQTPIKWGINGKVDQRLQRYIAARLGPIPGWTMGYGFDLDEWVNESQLKAWRDTMHEYMAWPHMLGGRHGDPNQGLDHSTAVSWNRLLDYSSYEHHRPSPEVYSASLEAVPGKPVFSEDRFRIRQSDQYRFKDYTEVETRRGLWHSTMAGGVANIWGKLDGDLSINMGFGASYPYENPHWIKTWSTFFDNRFAVESVPANPLTDGLALAQHQAERLVFYREETESMDMDLSQMSRALPAIAVDTTKPYREITLGMLKPEQQTWKAPYRSDWSLAVGYFDKPYTDSPVIKDLVLDWSSHKRYAQGSDNFQLTWSDDDHLYGAWGDGGGFNGTNSLGRVGLGFARIEGDSNNYRGYNVWGGHEAKNLATFDGKSWGTISIGGTLYMWVVPDKPEGKGYRNHYEYVELARSTDKGASWTKAPWRFEEAEELTIPTFLNFGKDNVGVPEAFGDYVYSYFIAPQSPSMEQEGSGGVGLIVHKPGKIFISRVRSKELMTGNSSHEFFTGLDADGRPHWGSLEEKQPVFQDANGVSWCLSASYNPHLKRVILATQHTTTTNGLLSFFDAPTPWGPWTTVKYYSPESPFGHVRPGSDLPWENNVFFAAFPTKWFDGDHFTMNFTGGGQGKDNDSFNTVEGRFILH
jgi:hypothetical protein